MSLRDVDLGAPVEVKTKKQLQEIKFHKTEAGPMVTASYLVPTVDGMRWEYVTKDLSEVLTTAQAKALIDKVVE